MRPPVGRTLGHYKVLSHLASGAMSDVYLAYDEELRLHVAVKVLTDAMVRQPESLQRFRREAQAAARLNHPNVARVFYINLRGDQPFFAMELIEGESLAEVLDHRKRFTIRQFLDIFEQAARGLRAAALRGIVHRDVKPGNLMIGRDGLVKVVDFGLAKLTDDKAMTRTGVMMGTPYYLSPEAIRGDPLDARSDLYSLGASMFHVLVGYPPYDAETPYAVLVRHVEDPVPRAADLNEQLPAPLSELIARLMAKDPARRYPNYEAFLNALAVVREASAPVQDRELALCGSCQVNTVADGERCTRCGRPYGWNRRPEAYDLAITGYRDGRAEPRVVEYLARALGRRPEMVRRSMGELPFRIGHRVAHAWAKEMAQTFHELGAEVELRPVHEDAGDPAAERLEFESAAIARTRSVVAPVPEELARLRPRGTAWRRPWLMGGMALAGVVLVAVLALVARHVPPAVPEPGEAEPAGADLGGGAADEPVETADGPGDAGPAADREADAVSGGGRAGWLELRVAGDAVAGEDLLDAVRDGVDAARTRLASSCTWTPSEREVLILRPRRPFRTEEDPRAWELGLGERPAHLPLGGLDPRDPDLAVACSHWVAHRAVEELAGEEVPPWIPLGLAVQQEGALAELDPAPFREVAREGGSIPLVFWGASPGHNPPEIVARAGSMVEFLVQLGGPDRFSAFLTALRGRGLSEALEEVYGAPADRIQRDWAESMRWRYE